MQGKLSLSLSFDHPSPTTVARIEKSPSTFEGDVRTYFQTHINDPDLYKEIPSLNDRHDEAPLPSGCLVRFRAMIQDMADDEIYCSAYFASPSFSLRSESEF